MDHCLHLVLLIQLQHQYLKLIHVKHQRINEVIKIHLLNISVFKNYFLFIYYLFFFTERPNSTEQNDIQEGLLEALRQPLNQPDAVDGILLRLGEGLRRLPYRERSLLEIQWLRELVQVEERCST